MKNYYAIFIAYFVIEKTTQNTRNIDIVVGAPVVLYCPYLNVEWLFNSNRFNNGIVIESKSYNITSLCILDINIDLFGQFECSILKDGTVAVWSMFVYGKKYHI